MTKEDALKLAHEALEANYQLINGTDTEGGLVCCIDGYYSDCFDEDPINEQTEKAIAAINEVLAQPEQEPVAWPRTMERGALVQWLHFEMVQHTR